MMRKREKVEDWYRIKFITDWVDFDFELPVELGHGLILRKASNGEISIIKEKKLFHHDVSGKPIYEAFIKNCDYGGIAWVTEVDENKWRYWTIDQGIIDFSKLKSTAPNQILSKDNLSYAASLLDCNLFLGFDIVYNQANNNIISYHPEFKKVQEANAKPRKPRLVKFEEIEPFSEYLDLISTINNEHEYLTNVIEEFSNLNIFTSKNKFKTLAKFALIESLLTHNPSDGGDSITKQIKAKVKLLNNRFTKPIIISDFFKTGSFEKIIGEVYSYRSAIAHGGKYDFSKNNVLESEMKVDHFINILLRRIIIQALREPQLLLDLKDC